MRINLLAAARVARASTLCPRAVLLARRGAGQGVGVGWQGDVALPAARDGGLRDVVAVWTGGALEEGCGRAQGDVGVDGEVEHERDEAVGAEDGVAGAEPVVGGHCYPAVGLRKSQLSLCGTALDVWVDCFDCRDDISHVPEHHHDHQKRRRGEISARQGVLDVRVFFLAAERRHADQARHAHWEETQGRKGIAGHNARGDEEGESRDHADDGDDAERAVLLSSTIEGFRRSVH